MKEVLSLVIGLVLGMGITLGLSLYIQPVCPEPICQKPICESPIINLSCPEPNVTKEVNIDLPYNNIQGSHLEDLKYWLSGNDFCIDDVDDYENISGYSMQPSIFTGNLILLEEYDDQELEEGDIIRYKTERGMIIHRIKGDYIDFGGHYITQGDNSRYIEKVYPGNITHTVIGVLYQ